MNFAHEASGLVRIPRTQTISLAPVKTGGGRELTSRDALAGELLQVM
jgi:hypothetical protein